MQTVMRNWEFYLFSAKIQVKINHKIILTLSLLNLPQPPINLCALITKPPSTACKMMQFSFVFPSPVRYEMLNNTVIVCKQLLANKNAMCFFNT